MIKLLPLLLFTLTNCVVFETIDKLPEPAVHAIMVPITMLPLVI